MVAHDDKVEKISVCNAPDREYYIGETKIALTGLRIRVLLRMEPPGNLLMTEAGTATGTILTIKELYMLSGTAIQSRKKLIM